ncbi:hypothetical protein [Bosea sp. BIWAKO-01]|uniref:hypothetical protein n=1 Tax=Bosea sp. BIWAKO-01 TaxID=506668 RepID=UPI000AD7ADA2|nr:hypothetical protein [Bosea sp. BIWAKO-01]
MSFSRVAKAVGSVSFLLGIVIAAISVQFPDLFQDMGPIQQIGAASFFFAGAFVAMQTLVKRMEGGHPDDSSLAASLKELSGSLLYSIVGLTVTAMSVWASLTQ